MADVKPCRLPPACNLDFNRTDGPIAACGLAAALFATVLLWLAVVCLLTW